PPVLFTICRYCHPASPHAFPTRRSSDLTPQWVNSIDNALPASSVLALAAFQNSTGFSVRWSGNDVGSGIQNFTILVSEDGGPFIDRKSTRLNSSHGSISYAVFCLKKNRT